MEAAALIKSRTAHGVLLVTTVLLAVRSAESFSFSDPASLLMMMSPILAFWFAGMIETTQPNIGASEACKRVAKVTVSWVLGIVGIVVFASAAEGGV